MTDFKRGRGHRPNHPSRRPKSAFAHAGHAAILSGSAAVPDAVDHASYLPPVMDQGPTGTCEAHTEAEVIYASLAFQGVRLGFVPSPDFIYRVANGLQRVVYNPGVPVDQLPALTDDGLEPVFATKAVELHGVVAMGATASDGRFSDVDPATINREVAPAEYTRAATRIVRGTSSLDVLDSERVDALCRLLASGKFLKVALFADYSAFYGYDGSSPLGAPPPNPGSNHAVTLHSYRAGGDVFVLRNHWGTGWGRSGDFEVTRAFVMTLTDIEVVEASLATLAGGA